MSASTALTWLERYGRRLTFQQLRPSASRRKNAIVLEYAGADGQTGVVGSSSVIGAVLKAQSRNSTARREADVA